MQQVQLPQERRSRVRLRLLRNPQQQGVQVRRWCDSGWRSVDRMVSELPGC